MLPAKSVGILARFSFNALTLNLIYGTIARTVSTSTIGSYWFIIAAAVVVIGTSYLTATLMGIIIKIKNPIDFDSLRISASFPNIVALPILIFPALCEYPVVYEAFGGSYQKCVDESTTMIFCYFFSWSFLFWTFGHSKLMAAANRRLKESTSMATIADPEHTSATAIQEDQQQSENQEGSELQRNDGQEKESGLRDFWVATRYSLIKTFTSPGFLAMLLGFITACIPPLQQALFSQGGALRFIGSAIETMGDASSSISTMVVAASLVPNKIVAEEQETLEMSEENDAAEPEVEDPSTIESPIMSDPNFGPRQRDSSIRNMTMVVRRRSSLIMDRIKRSDHDMMRLHVWFMLSRLILTPAIISGGLVALDCSGALTGIPNLSKLVVVVNAALPGALIVVVLLKSQPALSESANVVAKVYLPSYMLSIVTIAAWASVGLYISVPQEDGTSFCGR